MKIKKWIAAFLLVAGGMSSCRRSEFFQEDLAGIEKERVANQILHKVAAKLKEETELHPVGTMGQMLREVERLGLSFSYYKPLDIAEGRKLLVQAVNAMLEEVNREEGIRPYLCRYPFLPRNVEVDIFLRSSDGRAVPPGNLWIVQAEGGYLRYRIDHPATHRLTTVYKETYEEALQRLADPSLPLAAFEPELETNQEELNKLRQGISFVADDGSIWHLSETGAWVQDPRSVKKRK